MLMRKLACFGFCLAAVAAIAFSTGCVSEDDGTLPGEKIDEEKESGGKGDAWDFRNDPTSFRVEFKYKLGELPTTGQSAKAPWPETYWPYYQDSINHRWQGHSILSPTEKYDKAFNNWTHDATFMNLRPISGQNCGEGEYDEAYYQQLGPAAIWQHQNKGLGRVRNGRDDDGDGETDECTDDWDGIETWWGLCHAWVPAAILEEEPIKPVTYNGVTFEVSDIKALLMAKYDSSSAHMLGGRCNEKDVEMDEHNRPELDQCRDTNAGSFHVVVTNMLGIHKRAFAEDKTYDYQVWNQPVYGYEITEQKEVSLDEALSLLGIEGQNTYPFNDQAKKFAEVRMTLRYITESSASTRPLVSEIDRYTRRDSYHYLLELDADGKIIGGEWLDSSRTSHPDFLWLPTRRGGGNPYVDYDKVKMLLDMSRADENGSEEGELKTFTQSQEIAIPDNAPSGVTSTLTVPEDVTVGSLKVKVNITHTYIGDLVVELRRAGQVITLHNRQGGSADNIDRTFDVDAFAGDSAYGEWELRISDHAGQDVGKLVSWSLLLSTGQSSGPSTSYDSNTAVEIPDNDPNGATSTISVGSAGTVAGLKVTVNIEHTYIGDLTVVLKHNGASRTLQDREGGGADNINNTYTVTEFNGSTMEGNWELFVKDTAGSDVGKIVSWSLEFTTN